MVSRLSNYLSSAKLAKMHLVEAEAANKTDQVKAMRHMIEAVKYLVTANNNLASIAFNHKPKRS